jgi:hypothetical protein
LSFINFYTCFHGKTYKWNEVGHESVEEHLKTMNQQKEEMKETRCVFTQQFSPPFGFLASHALGKSVCRV